MNIRQIVASSSIVSVMRVLTQSGWTYLPILDKEVENPILNAFINSSDILKVEIYSYPDGDLKYVHNPRDYEG